MKLEIDTAPVFYPLLASARYKAAWGGRGSGKSHFFAELMIEEHLRFPGFRSVCIREVQKSLKDSAKRLLEDKIRAFDLEGCGFVIYNDRIETPGGGVIIFMGLKDSTAETVKSLEGFDRAWVEEAQTLSDKSLRMLRPTIRKAGSQIWFSWNPRFAKDAVDKFLRQSPPENSIIVQANWYDNPWFPGELEEERREDKKNDEIEIYLHIWEGQYIRAIEGAYYNKHLQAARKEHRIGRVPADPAMPVFAYADIGSTSNMSDAFTFWMVQFIGKEVRLVAYYEAIGQEIHDHIDWLQENEFSKARIKLPHDGGSQKSPIRMTWASEFKKSGFKVQVMQNAGKGAAMKRVRAGRKMFPYCSFDEEGCQEYGGLDALGWYHEKKDTDRDIGLGPEHDWSSHCADAFGEVALDYEIMTKIKPPKEGRSRPVNAGGGGWMGG
jgi:phage terminase large subunit